MGMVFIILVLLVPLPLSVHAGELGSHKTPPGKSLQPMNVPMDELGVTGHDTTLCSDRWYTCGSYDRQQFDQKYPGTPLKELLRYGEPDWPVGERQRRDRTGSHDFHDTIDHHDRLDKD